jgi:hypothetical protein
MTQRPTIMRLPTTPEGRQALRDHLFILRTNGVSPLDCECNEVDWDEVGKAVASLPESYWSEVR